MPPATSLSCAVVSKTLGEICNSSSFLTRAWLLGIVLYDGHYSVFGRTLQICTEQRSAVGIRQIGKWIWTNLIVTLFLSFVDVLPTPPAFYVMDSL
jgi:hypothetical protein